MHVQFHSIPTPATTTRPFLVPIPIKTYPKITQPIDLQYNPIRKQHKLSSSRLVVLASSSAASPSSSSNNNNALWWESLLPPTTITKTPSLSDILWPSAGAFVAMAVLGKIDEFLAPKGVSLTIAPLGAVCAVLFAAPSSPAAQKYNMFVAQIGCAAIGVLAFTLLGPGWLARSASLAASIAFMIYTRSTHPPAASLPLLFIDGAKLHHLNLWYAVFPGATACVILCLLQQMVYYLNIEMIGADQIINPVRPVKAFAKHPK